MNPEIKAGIAIAITIFGVLFIVLAITMSLGEAVLMITLSFALVGVVAGIANFWTWFFTRR